MAACLARFSVTSCSSSSRDEVYVAAMALRASKGPARFLFSTSYSLNFWDLHHFMVIVNPTSTSNRMPTVYDFQPQDPENIWVAAAALSGRKVAGVILVRKLEKLPKRKCWFVGYAKGNDDEAAAQKFNRNWETDLILGYHDCRHYTQGLVEYLTGNKAVLDHLRANQYTSI
ncbi:hypothetical protein C2S51_003614 [Perilla frutescens var. frutescens]|nr:hypothetical protein C2S51_003614 [Perilla frutescens var. frutescens]